MPAVFLGSSPVELLELIPKLAILRLKPGGDSKENSNLKNLLDMISVATKAISREIDFC
jgi:hypothetical protein